MAASLDEVRDVIQTAFPGSDVEGIKEENHRLVGTIVWEGFKNKDITERDRMVTEKVRDKLGLKGLNLGLLFPLAPGEKLS